MVAIEGSGGELVTVRPDRARRIPCRRTQVVIEADLLPRRAYTVCFLGQALGGVVRGHGHWQIVAELGVPEGAVCGWLIRARRTAEQLWCIGIQVAGALDPGALPTADRGDLRTASRRWWPPPQGSGTDPSRDSGLLEAVRGDVGDG